MLDWTSWGMGKGLGAGTRVAESQRMGGVTAPAIRLWQRREAPVVSVMK